MLRAYKTPFSRGQKPTHSPAREERDAGQETPLHYTHECQHLPSKVGRAQLHSCTTRPADPNPYTFYWMALTKSSQALLAPLSKDTLTQRH